MRSRPRLAARRAGGRKKKKAVVPAGHTFLRKSDIIFSRTPRNAIRGPVLIGRANLERQNPKKCADSLIATAQGKTRGADFYKSAPLNVICKLADFTDFLGVWQPLPATTSQPFHKAGQYHLLQPG